MWWTDDSKNKENGPFLTHEDTYLSEDFLFYCYWAEKEGIHNVLRHCRLAKSNQFLHTHTHTHTHGHSVVFYVTSLTLLCLFVSLVLVFYWVCYRRIFISTTEQSRAPSQQSQLHLNVTVNLCACVYDPLWCLFHFISVSLSLHFRSEILNVPGFKKQQHLIDQDPARALISV